MDNTDNINNELESLSVSKSYQCIPEQCKLILKEYKRQHSLKTLHLNIRSIERNIDEAKILLTRLNFDCDVLIFTECWLSKSTTTPILTDYVSFRSAYRNQNDGVIIYVRASIECTVTEPVMLDASCLLFTYANKLAIIAVYRSPSIANADRFMASLNKILSSLSAYQSVAIIGDVNINITPHSTDRNSNEYLNLTASHGMLPAHLYPTRNSNCIDHVILRTHKKATTIVLDCSITDHSPVLLCNAFQGDSLCKNNSKTRTRLDYSAVTLELKNTDYSQIFQLSDANIAMDTIIKIISSIILTNRVTFKVPSRQRTIKPWITPGLLKCIRNRDSLHAKVKGDPENSIKKITYIRYRNFCNNLLKRLKRDYEKNEFQKARGNPKATWKVVKKVANIQQHSSAATPLLYCSSDPTSSLNKINDYFVGIGAELANKITTQNRNNQVRDCANSNFPTMAIFGTDCDEVDSTIRGLRRNCAVGWDGIPSGLLMDAREVLVPPLTHIFNLCLTTGVFPKSLKKALVLPVLKGGSGDSVNNYRPISILSSISKILEKLLNVRLSKYLDKHNIISKNQYGFRKGMSAEDAVTDLINTVVHHVDNKLQTIGVFLDLSKAFDTVSTSKLLLKMERLGIRGLALDIFRDYLTDRSQCVRVDGHVSDDKTLCYGVPQGSILGPVLFLLYVNDLCHLKIPNCNIFTYADDTALVVRGESWCDAKNNAEHALNIVMDWLTNNLLTLNISKTNYMTFATVATSQPPSNYSIIAHHCSTRLFSTCTCCPLSRTEDIRYLGVQIDSTLSWKAHIHNLTSRARRLIYIFKKIRSSASAQTLKIVYYSLAQSILTYCDTAWGGACTTTMLQLERAQRAILKVMTHKPIRFPTVSLYKEAEVLNVRQLYVLHTILRKHRSIAYDPELDQSQRKRSRICSLLPHRTTLANRHYEVLANRLYNKINSILHIYPLPLSIVKIVSTDWLKTLSYHDTEELIKPT